VHKSVYVKKVAGENLLEKNVHDYIEWVNERAGGKLTRVIKRLLIANNGIAAVKCIRCVRDWVYQQFGDAHRVHFICMATPEDVNANAEYIRMADELIEVPGADNRNNYANVQLITDVAIQTKADGVWPGWGHASEYPALPTALRQAGVVWVGPSPEAMQALGDKITSSLIAQNSNVPCLPWSGSNIKLDGWDVSDEAFARSCVHNWEEASQRASEIGYPLMVKASGGGGGKGIRKVERTEDMEAAYRQCTGEVPGSPVFLMRLLPDSRHLEVQLLCDMHGNAIALFGRDCSVQRRHQKIIEEGPVTAANAEAREAMQQSAVDLAKAVDYVGVGTVEYLFNPSDGKYYFLELNPRLQVEHPVTEMISDVNLPSCMVLVAMGVPLHLIPDIRKLYGYDPQGTTMIDFDLERPNDPTNHVIACRITSENSEFRVTQGEIRELTFRSGPYVWGYFGLKTLSTVHNFADSQFGHIFAQGETRELARRHMAMALEELDIRGEISNTIEYLRWILETDDFKNNRITTTWLEAQIPKYQLTGPKLPKHLSQTKVVILGAIAQAYEELRDKKEKFLNNLKNGRVETSRKFYQSLVRCNVELILKGTKYRLQVKQIGPNEYQVFTRGQPKWSVEVHVRGLQDGGILMSMDCHTHVVYTKKVIGGNYEIRIDSNAFEFEEEYDPSEIRTKAQGKMVTFLVEEGAHVDKGQAFGEIESMKLVITLKAQEAGMIRFHVAPGAILAAGQILATLDLDDKAGITQSKPFTGFFPRWGPPHLKNRKAHMILSVAVTRIENILKGYVATEEDVHAVVGDMIDSFRDPRLPAHELMDVLSSIEGKISENVYQEIMRITTTYLSSLKEGHHFPWERPLQFPAQRIQTIVNLAVVKSKSPELEQIMQVVDKYSSGVHIFIVKLITHLMNIFYEDEKHFAGEVYINVIHRLRREESDLDRVAGTVLAHFSEIRAKLIIKLLEVVENIFNTNMAKFTNLLVPELEKLSTLNIPMMSDVHLAARQILLNQKQSQEGERLVQMRNLLNRYRPPRAPGDPPETPGAAKSPQSIKSPLPMARTNSSNQFNSINIRRVGSSGSLNGSEGLSATAPGKKRSGEQQPLGLHMLSRYSTSNVHEQEQDEETTEQEFGWSQQQTMVRQVSDILGILPEFMLDEKYCKKALDLFVRNVFWDWAVKPMGFEIEQGTWSSMKFQISTAKKPRYPHIHRKNETLNAMFAFTKDLFHLKEQFDAVLETFEKFVKEDGHAPECFIAGLGWSGTAIDDDQFLEQLQGFLRPHHPRLMRMKVKYLSVLVHYKKNEQPALFTFPMDKHYTEDPITRHILPSMVPMLEINRLKNFNITLRPTPNRNIHVFEARPKVPLKGRYDGRRFFVRSPVTQRTMPSQLVRDLFQKQIRVSGPEVGVMQAINSLEAAMSGMSTEERAKWQFNQIFLCCFFDVDKKEIMRLAELRANDGEKPDMRNTLQEVGRETVAFARAKLARAMSIFQNLLRDLNVTRIEVRIQGTWTSVHDKAIALRMVVNLPNPECFESTEYWEVIKPDGSVVLKSARAFTGRNPGIPPALDGTKVDKPHPVMEPLMQKRVYAALQRTTYVYDWIRLFKQAVKEMWNDPDKEVQDLMKAQELMLDDSTDSGLKEVTRPEGKNAIGMVAWRLTIRTPNFPEGRDVILCSNDLTVFVGSFGTKEDDLYHKACLLAEAEGIPFLYMAANSGARLGLDQKLMKKFKVAWKGDPAVNPQCGFNYLYLTEDDFKSCPENSVICEKIFDAVSKETRYKIKDVVGEKGMNLGVENLMGSGLIAGDTSRAYKNIVTMSYVTARTVGIGAYIVRLGQRIIQCAACPILLTGHEALNNLLGKDVYSSNLELGGLGVMLNNGVSHLCVYSDLEGVCKALEWLSYIPKSRSQLFPLPTNPLHDPIDRLVDWSPPAKAGYDPRNLIDGMLQLNPEGTQEPQAPAFSPMLTALGDHSREQHSTWVSGFFDKGTFVETLHNWAKTVVTGRARLGGIPVGVIAVETRGQECIYPSDPANPESREEILNQAGQVWYPDSAFKTAQAIQDMNTEDLPLMIFANWRGFSGGQRDMFHQVLKFGSLIVDALRDYKHPVFVYLPPLGELRGGAWVVLDSNINPDNIEMYASETARGGVLEPSGAAGLKFRGKRLKDAAMRLDPVLRDLNPAEDVAEFELREKNVLPVYRAVASKFADLHDTPGGMQKKGAIRAVVPWAESREFFYWRLRRLRAVRTLAAPLREFAPDLESSPNDIVEDLVKGALTGDKDILADNPALVRWLENSANAKTIASKVKAKVHEAGIDRVRKMAEKLGLSKADLQAAGGAE